MSSFTLYQPTPAVKLHLVFANDEAYGHAQSDHAIHRSLNQISMMSHSQWSALQTLHLEELPNSRSATLTRSLTYGKFISTLLQSLHRAKHEWKYLPYPNFGLRLTNIRIDGYDPEPALLVPSQPSPNKTLRIALYGIQSALEFILECLSAPLSTVYLTNVTMPIFLLQTLASISNSLHVENVFGKVGSEVGRTLRNVKPHLATSLQSLWVDAAGLSAYFYLDLPQARIRILHLRIGDRLREVYHNGIQSILNRYKDSLEELRYEPYWVGCHPAEQGELSVCDIKRTLTPDLLVATINGINGDIECCLDFSQLIGLRVLELMLPSMVDPNRYSRIAVWMAEDGGKLARRISNNSPPGIGVNRPLHGPSFTQIPRSDLPFRYGIRLIGFQAVERDSFYRPFIDIQPHQMKLDLKIDTLRRGTKVQHRDFTLRWCGWDDVDLGAGVQEPALSRW